MNYIKQLFNYRNEIKFLSFQTVKKQYAGTVFGPIWALAQPLVYMLVFFFFYKFGLRFEGDIEDAILTIFAANIVWLLMSQAMVQGTKVFITNAVLVKTLKFPVVALPLIDVLAKVYVHIAVLIMTVLFFILAGAYPTIYYINFLFYIPLVTFFLMSLSFLLGSLAVVFKDMPQFLQSITMPLFWVTPIIWSIDDFNQPLVLLVERLVNPFYFFVEGYRHTMLPGQLEFFWENPLYDLYFLSGTCLLFLIGTFVFNRIRPLMADYL